MPEIRPISDLRNKASEISDYCRETREPVFITRNGTGDMVVMNIDEYERRSGMMEVYRKLHIAEQEIAAGAQGENFTEVAGALRELVHGKTV